MFVVIDGAGEGPLNKCGNAAPYRNQAGVVVGGQGWQTTTMTTTTTHAGAQPYHHNPTRTF